MDNSLRKRQLERQENYDKICNRMNKIMQTITIDDVFRAFFGCPTGKNDYAHLQNVKALYFEWKHLQNIRNQSELHINEINKKDKKNINNIIKFKKKNNN